MRLFAHTELSLLPRTTAAAAIILQADRR